MDWGKELEKARLYAKAVDGMLINRKFDNETLYHIICLSIERYTSTLAYMLNYIPMHSGLSFVVRELGKKMELPSNFIDEARFLNSFMTYCSLDFEQPKVISEPDLARMVAFLTELKLFTEEKAKNAQIA
jgi:hypothetical protein